MAREAARALRRDGIDPAQPLAALGLDSLAAVELVAAVAAATGIEVPLDDLFAEGMSLAGLAAAVRAAGRGGAPAAAPVAPVSGAPDEPGEHPLSAGQRALWLVDRLAPESAPYNLAGAARVQGELDVAAFRRAWERLAERHPALRTTFEERGGEPFRRVHVRLPCDLELAPAPASDAAHASHASDTALAGLLADAAWKPFDLARGPLLRVRLWPLGDGHALLVAVHHLIADFHSLAVLFRELGELYRAERSGGAAGLGPAPAGYGAFVRWQEGRLAGPEGERLWEHWRRRLAGELPVLDLPADRPRPPVQTWIGLSQRARLDAAVAGGLRALAREGGATLYMVLLAGFAELLARYGAAPGTPIGTPVAGRGGPPGIADSVGYFVNPLVMRMDGSGEPGEPPEPLEDPTVAERLDRARATALDAFAHQDLPFALLAERLGRERDPSRPPLVQALLVLQRMRSAEERGLAALALGDAAARVPLADLALSPLPLDRERAPFDLTLTAAESGDGLFLALQVNAALFDAPTCGRMLSHLGALLAGMGESPECAIASLDLLSAAERSQLAAWNETAAPQPADLTVHDLFTAQAARTPEAVAVVGGGRRWTYRELDRHAACLARRLLTAGVGPEVRVAVAADRSPRLIAALLAVWRAGGAYVPLDPALPRERRAWILADSGARVLLGEARHLADLPAGGARVLLDASDADGAGAAADGAEPSGGWPAILPESWPAIWPENLAYLIYTSGSTGAPKGVAIEHRSAVALVAWAASAYSAAELGGVLAATSIGFDLSVFEIFVPLCLGGQVIVAESALALPVLPEASQVRLVNTVPSVLAELLREGGLPPGVATINLAGEALRRELVRAIAAGTAARRLVNLYGPSEATTYSTWAEVELAASDDGEPAIGWPIANTRAHVLDRRLRAVPVGVPGEICLGGAGLARGYLGRPELTAERFVPSPFATPFSGHGEAAGARLYRTGDLARRRPHGDLEFLGRLDDQVKIRGVRIEPGEVEAALLACPEVAAAAVAARRGPGGEPFLAAYVVPRGEGLAAAAGLRESLRRRLPEAMVPAAFVLLGELPLGATGKVDRRALAALPLAPERPAGGAEPRTPLEAALAAVWAEVLGVEAVGVDDDFFDLGGHSLVAARLRARIAERLGVELPLGTFFRATTVARLAAVLEAALPGGAARADAEDAPRPLPRDGRSFPLSFAQERLWLLERLRPGTAAYHLPGGIRLAGPLSPAALRRALAGLARRHEALRTRFPDEGGAAVQAIDLPAAAANLPEIALDALPDSEREAGRLAAAEAARPFDLARGPLWRARLLRLGRERHDLLLTLHHLIADEASLAILVDELAALYAGRALPPPPAVQAADLAVWQRERLQGETVERELAWWAERLAGLPPLDLPADRPRPPAASARGDVAALPLPASAAAGLGALARQGAATPFMALLAGLHALLGRIAGTDDLAVGCPLSSRGDRRGGRSLEGAVGLFVDTLVLRADLAGDPDFSTLLARVREATLAAHEHGGLPFDLLVARLQPARSAGRNPLFDVAFALEHPPAPREGAGLRLAPFAVPTGTAKFDLTLFARRVSTEAADGTLLTLEHSLDLFDRTTARRLLGTLAELLAGAVADPGRRLSALPLLADAECFQLVVEWGEGAPAVDSTPAETGATVVSRVARQAARRPRALAVRGGGREMTYGELDALSRRLAARLRRVGVGGGSVVGVLLDRSPEMVAAFLGAMRAGAAYLPLDPAQPAERLASLLADAGAAAVVTGDGTALAGSAVRSVRLDDLAPGAEVDPGESESEPSPAQLAYVLYTSGSSGRPKGVEVSHESLASLVDWHLGAYGVTAADRAAQTAAIGFDAAVWELWPYLAAGASVHLADEATRLVPERLRDWLIEEEIDLAFLPTPLAEAVLALPWPPRTALRALLTGGDRLRRLPPPGLPFWVVNHYGPTEGTVVATAGAVHAANAQAERPPAIGRPIAGARVYVLDAACEPTPLGVPGELCLGGAGVARGYRGRPDLTAERFLPDPFARERGARLYRTGDRARWRTEGDLGFLGRLDQQVKVRGVRIEPGEIEAALAGHPALRQAAVVLRGERLVAFWVANADRVAAAAELRAFLQARLPEPMIPAVFVPLAALPLSTHGKVDRAALPDVDVAPGPRTPPRTPTERRVAAVWAEVLGREEGSLAAEDDFFALGGHSLLAMRVVSRLRDARGVELSLRAAFDRPLLADFAAALDAASGADLAAPPLVRRGTPWLPDTAPLSFAQERLWFLDQLEPGSPVYNLPAALRLRGALDPAALRRAIEGVVARHEALRTTFRSIGGELVQEVGPPLPFALPSVDLTGLGAPASEAETLRLAREDARRPFALALGPLLRATLLLLARGEHALLWNVHHIVFDGWSLGVFLRELGALYRTDGTDAAANLPPLPVQYADFAAWQRERLRGAALAGHLAHWRERLAGAPAVVELPADRPRPPLASFRGGSRRLALDAGTAAALRALARRAGATPFMVLLASFAALLSRLSGRRDLVVGTPTASRDRPELELLVGFFADSLVLRLDLGADPTFAELLAGVRASTLDAYAHQEVPFDKLVEALRPERDLSHNPIYQIVFALDGSERPALALPGVEVSPLPAGGGTAKFDLALYMEDREGELAGLLEHSHDLFDDTTAERFLAAFAALTAAACRDAGRRLAELPILGDAERHRLLVELNDTERRPPPEPFVHRLIAARAAAAPGAPAVSQAGRTLAYGELDRRANQLAHRLRRLGVGPESRVAVALSRSPELIAAMLGIWKAGGAYVPLDLAYPPDRLAYMLESSRAAVLLTEAGLAESLRLLGGGSDIAAVPLLLDPDWSALAGEPDGDPDGDPDCNPEGDPDCNPVIEPGFALSPRNLAYVIYTSGSTGRPKGTMIEHGSLASYVETAVAAYGITAGDRVLQFCSISFDISLEEIVPCLACGAELVLRTPEMIASIAAFLAACGEQGVTMLSLPTAYWHEIVAKLDGESLALPPSLRLVVIAGERALPERLLAWRRHAGARPRLVNTYGLTESTIISTVGELTAAAADGVREAAIGRVIPDTEIYLLDGALRPAPLGVPGEMYLGGGLLARGYLGRPEATAERFVPHPGGSLGARSRLDGELGARLYRTGDLARVLPDGELEFLGRGDHQVKIRGYRIELQEIEAALALHPDVEALVVAAPEERPGQRRLVAYVVSRRQPPPATGDLRSFLARSLPEYMLPAAFAFLDALPLTPNGKVDRGALPPLAGLELAAGAAYAPPRDEVEGAVAEIWRQALGVERVGIHDNFFDLGGHSLLLARVHEALEARFGCRLPMVDLFTHPTVDALARRLRQDAPAAPPVERQAQLEARAARAREVVRAGPARILDARRRVRQGGSE